MNGRRRAALLVAMVGGVCAWGPGGNTFATTLHWSGGTTDKTDGTPISYDATALAGDWNLTTKNWATDDLGTEYVPFADGAFAVLGGMQNAGNNAVVGINILSDLTLSGFLASLQPAGANNTFSQQFQLNASAPRLLTLAGAPFTMWIIATEISRHVRLQSNVQLSGGAPLRVRGGGLLDVRGTHSGYSGAIEVASGRMDMSAGSGFPAVTQMSARGYPSASVASYVGNAFETPSIRVIPGSNGLNDQLHDNLVVTLSSGQFDYRGRRNNTPANVSTEVMGQLVLEPFGVLALSATAAAGSNPAALTLSHPTAGINRGAQGRGTMIVGLTSGSAVQTDVIVQNGVTVGGILPWMSHNRAGFMRLNASTKAIELVPSTAAPTALNTWVAASDYKVGDNSAFTPSGQIGSLSINSLGFFVNPAATLTIGASDTLTIASGGIAFQPTAFGAHATLNGGQLASGTDQLHLHTGDSANSATLYINSAIIGGGMDVIKAGVANAQFGGTVNNTYSGTTYINKGHLVLAKTGGAISVPGDLVIRRSGSAETSSTSPFGPASRLIVEDGGLFTANSPYTQGGRVTLNAGRYHLLNHAVILGDGLSFNGGTISHNSTALGTVSLYGSVSYASTSTAQAVWTRYGTGLFTVELDGTNRIFDIAASSVLPAGTPEMVFDIPITNGQGTAANSGITKTGSGTLKFTMTNYYAGPTVIEAGTLHVGTHSAPAQSGLRASMFGSGANFDAIIFHEPVASNMVRGQAISGTGVGAGRSVLRVVDDRYVLLNGGSQTTTDSVDVAVSEILRYGSLGSGPVTNNGGTLLVDSGITLANAMTVNGGAVTNNGVFTGPLTVNGGTVAGGGSYDGVATLFGGVILAALNNNTTVNGNLYPGGGAIGTLQVNGNVTWNSGNSWSSATDWHFQLGASPASDKLNINGDFNKGAGSAFRFDFGGSGQIGTFTLVEWTGSTTFSASDFSFVNLASGYAATFQIVGNALQVTVAGCVINPTITLGANPASVCSPGSPLNSEITYSAVSGSPTHYILDFSDTANFAGFADTSLSPLPVSPLPFIIPAGAPKGVYTGKVIVVVNSTGCRGESEFVVTINATPAMPGTIAQANPAGASVCADSSGVTYSIAPVDGATTYTWSVPVHAAILAGQGSTQITVNWADTTPAGSHTISVNAGNACGTSATRTGSFTVRTGAPLAPTAAQPTDVSISSFTANWSAPSQPSGQEFDSYRLDVATGSDFTTGFIVSNLTLGSSTHSYTLTGLSGGLTYYYRVRAVNACGAGPYSDVVTALTPLILVGWDVNGLSGGSGNYGASPLNAIYQHSAVNLVGLTRGGGVAQAGVAAPRGWGGTGWDSASAAAAITAGRFATFDITPGNGNFISFYSISRFDYRRSGDGPTSGKVQYSINGGPYTDIADITYPGSSAEGATLTQLPIQLDGIAALQNVPATDTVTFRIVNHGASSASGDWYIYDRFIDGEHDFELRGTVCSNPPAFNVTGGGAYCSGGGGVVIQLSGSTAGVTYSLYRDNGGSPLLVTTRAGTGGSLNFGAQTVADTYTVTAVRNSGGCSTVMNGSAVVTIDPAPGAPTDLIATPDDGEVSLAWNAPIGDTVTGYRVKRATISGGPYTTVTGGDNVAGTTFLDTTALNGATYYYVVHALNAACEGVASGEVEAEMPDGCPPGYTPTMNPPGNRTANVGYLLTHAVTASEVTDGCAPPALSHTTLPTGMTHNDVLNGRHRTRTFTWQPVNGQQGVYPITVTATDNENLSTSVTFVIFVGNFGESGNGTPNPPNTLTNWSVAITNLIVPTSGNATLVWTSVEGVHYDILVS
ncbi:MAG TPA: fibronectin type III domain-containing protein, partial [Kiritimatiellia bacterium]|nr:fibronectin type III domain-containing protein [Kiritimatiellia bacterium]